MDTGLHRSEDIPAMVRPLPNQSGDVPIKTGRLRALGIKADPRGRSFYFVAHTNETLHPRRYARRFPMTEDGWRSAWAAFSDEDPAAAEAYLHPEPGTAPQSRQAAPGQSARGQGDLGYQPVSGSMSMPVAVMECLRKYAVWQGRAARAEYWWWVLAHTCAVFAALLIDSVLGSSVLTILVIFGLLLPAVSVTVRRLHDIGRSGAWYWISLVPLVGPIFLLVLTATEGTRGPNSYGPPPAAPAPRVMPSAPQAG